MTTDYHTIPQVDIALGRAALRRGHYLARGEQVSAAVQEAVVNRLLDDLMAERDAIDPAVRGVSVR